MVSRGSSSPPKARMVTPLPPVNAVKAEHNKAVATTVPRTAPPNRTRNNRLRRKAAPVRAKISPASVNRGRAGSDGLTVME